MGSRPAFVADLCYETSELVACRSTMGIGGKFAFFAGDGQPGSSRDGKQAYRRNGKGVTFGIVGT